MARTRAIVAKNLIGKGQINSWDDLTTKARIPMTGYHEDEFNYESCMAYLEQYVELAGESATPQLVAIAQPKTVYARDTGEVQFGGFRKLPQQEKAINYLIKHLFKDKDLKGVLLPLDPGDGKGVIAAILSRYVLEKACRPGMNNVLIVTPKPVKIPMIRKLERVGIPEDAMDFSVTVLSYPDLYSATFKDFFIAKKVKNEIDGNVSTVYTYRGAPPDLVILDESHKLKKPGSRIAKICKAFIGIGTRIILTSATPAVTIADNWFFALASGLKDLEGQEIGPDSWPTLARSLAAPGKPTDINDSAMKRFNDYFAPAICRPPRDVAKYKTTIALCVEDMPNIPALRKKYYDAERDWLRAKDRAGESISDKGIIMARFQVLRAAAELLSVDIFVDRIKRSLAKGHVPVIGVCFQVTLREIVMRCVDQGILTRDQISVIWGGKRDIRLEEVYNDQEFVEVSLKGDDMTPAELRKVKLTREYMVQRLRLNLDAEQNEVRTARLRELQLFKQDETSRQKNMDDFQTGVTKLMVFTLASGGTGVDLDHQDTRSWQRDVYLTTCYYAEEFIQGMGRCSRKATLTDVHIEILVLDGTIAAIHVVPVLQPKIRSVRTLAAGSMDLVTVLEKKATFADLEKTSGAMTVTAELEDIDATAKVEEDDADAIDTDDDDKDDN